MKQYNTWTWVDKANNPYTAIDNCVGAEPLPYEKSTNEYAGYYADISVDLNRGPCGLAKNFYGISPYRIGAGLFDNYGICNSDPMNCKDCPNNPNYNKRRDTNVTL